MELPVISAVFMSDQGPLCIQEAFLFNTPHAISKELFDQRSPTTKRGGEQEGEDERRRRRVIYRVKGYGIQMCNNTR